MSGIAGIAYSKKSGRVVDAGDLARMRDVLFHRGPDDADGFIAENIGLAHRRLSIGDAAGGGRQPMTNEDGSLQIVFNGEIYNHADYREELTAKNHVFKTDCDTETILHLYEEHGAECVEFLRGMFAFAIWDANKNELFIARDRLGVKPLYYVFDEEGSLYFASEMKSLLQGGAVVPEINYAVLPEHFANHGTSGEETLLLGVKRLLPGHFLLWRDGEIEIKKYWDVSFEPKAEIKDERKAVAEWHEIFTQSVKMMSDAPPGMFLCGGLDSSAIAATMTANDTPIKTFSVTFAEQEANEFERARLIAEKFKTEHHEIFVTPQEFFDSLPKLVWHEDEPLAFQSCVPLFFVSKLAQENQVKAVLTGEGCDETLGGNGRYQQTVVNLNYGKRYEKYTPKIVRDIIRYALQKLPPQYKSRLDRTFLNLPANVETLFCDNFAVFQRNRLAELFSEETKERIGEINPYSRAKGFFDETDAEGFLDKLLFADAKTYLPELLMKQDRMSMAASIEARVPFLDHKLVEFTAQLPENFKLRGRETKWILREAMRGVLPEDILTYKQTYSPAPLADWLRGEFRHVVDEYVLSERALSRGIFNADFVREIVARHELGENHAERIWSLINFEIWQRQFIDVLS